MPYCWPLAQRDSRFAPIQREDRPLLPWSRTSARRAGREVCHCDDNSVAAKAPELCESLIMIWRREERLCGRTAVGGHHGSALMDCWRSATCVIVIGVAFAGTGCGANGSAQLSSAPTKPHSVELKWKASTSPDVIGYNVYRTTSSSGKGRSKHPIQWQKITSKPVSGTTYADKAVLSRTTYYYAVTAVDSKSRESAFCAWVRAVVP